jgi:hypothetical protein
MTGRPTKLTADVSMTIIESVEAGNYRSVAAATAGIDRSTLYRWIERGERDRHNNIESVYRDFCDGLARAEGNCEAKVIEVLLPKLLESDPRTALEWLARRWPKRWGRTDRPAGNGDDLVVAEMPRELLDRLSPAELEAMLEKASNAE